MIRAEVPYVGGLPTRSYDDPAGSDLALAEDAYIGPGETVLVPTTTRLSAPEGTFALVALRSSMPKRGLAIPNGIGVVDRDYTGTIFVWLHNFNDRAIILCAGERVAQVVFVPYVTPEFVEVDDLEETLRGDRGFGSSNRPETQE